MSNINEIVDVTIEIESPATSSASFSDMLLVIPVATTAGDYTLPTVAKINSAKELLDYGYVATDAAYLAAAVAFAQNPGPSSIYVTARLNVTQEDTEAGTTITVPEPIATTLNRALEDDSWYGFAVIGPETSYVDIKDAADWAESNSKLFGFTWVGETCPIEMSGYDHTFAFYAGDTGSDATEFYHQVAIMAKNFAYDPGSETWALKSLTSVLPSTIASAKISTLDAVPSNYYYTVASRNITQRGKVGSGEFIDVIRFKDWLLNEIQIQEYSFLTANPKVPFNDDGITGVQNILESVLRGAQKVGGIDEDRFDEDGNVEPGYVVRVPKAASLSKSDRRARKLRGVTFEARLAGAIHMVYIHGSLTY